MERATVLLAELFHMADTDQEAKKMICKVSAVEVSSTSESNLDNDVTKTDKGYTLHKGGQKPDKLSSGSPSSSSAVESEGMFGIARDIWFSSHAIKSSFY
eukprot:GHVL01007151.1.p1 GENE.GHVL01007151.1~~GHVL01007151.1.p1  ORF type:complete len:100 (+),score=13.68 GHVL01007151.1:365-664(+)